MKYPFAAPALLLAVLFAAAGMLPPSAHAQYRFRERNGSSSNQINAQMSQLPAQAVQSIPIPILFGVSLSDITPNFGEPRPGGMHEGLDILAATGTPIISPTQAVVLSVGVYTGGGNYVSTANPGGENFVYMHLVQPSTLTPGTMLQPGDLIGYVGSTGDAAGGPAHVHFEIRKDRVATNPYVRITQELTLAQKMAYLTNILASASMSTTARANLVTFLVGMYPGQFVAAQTAGIVLPQDVTAELKRISSGGLGIYTSMDLSPGMRGPAVVALQDFLIIQNKGPASRALGNAGATGSFGPITKNALIEYQIALNIVPANGYYAAATRIYVQGAGTPPTPTPVPAPATSTTPGGGASGGTGGSASSTALVPAHDLQVGSRSIEVTWLQSFLIAAKKGPAAQSLAAAGATGYFGPITRNALAEYQKSVGITPAVGYFGPVTRAYLLNLL